jgi:hypothetical protein
MYDASRDSKLKETGTCLSPQILLQRLAGGGIVELDRWWIRLDNYGSQVLCRHPHGIDVSLRGLNLASCEFVLKMIAGEHSPRSWAGGLTKKLESGTESSRQSFQSGGFGSVLCPVR